MTLTTQGVRMNKSEIPFDIEELSVYCCCSSKKKIQSVKIISIHFLPANLPEESCILSEWKMKTSINIFSLSDRLSRRSHKSKIQK